MASFRHDTELMTNMVSATPVAAGSTFSAFLHPVTRRPVVLGLSSDKQPKLELIAENDKGDRILYDLGEKLGIPQGTVQTFAARQDTSLQIFIVIAYKANENQSNILIPKPFSLTSLDNLKKYQMQSMLTVETFFMGPITATGEWPLIVAAHKRFDRGAGGSDITRILFDNAQDRWDELAKFSLPENASRIVDVCAGSSIHGKGIWVLYVIQDKMRLLGIFADRDRHGRITYQQVQPDCPVGATLIQSYVVDNGNTALLIGADRGLFYLSPDKSVHDHSQADLVCSEDIFKSPLRLDVVQDGSHMTIWSLGRAEDLGYVRTEASSVPKGDLKSILLMPRGQSSGFAAAVCQPDLKAGMPVVTQNLISNDNHGNLSWLQQNTDTGIWKTEPFVVLHRSEVYEVESYTISVTAIDDKRSAVSEGSVNVTADSTVQAWVNGRLANISSTGTRLSLDLSGELSLIIATSGIAGRVLTLDDLRDKDNQPLSTPKQMINPTEKIMAAFSSVKSGTDLTKLKTKSGESLYGPGDEKPSEEDLKTAATCIGNLNEAMTDIKSGTNQSSTEAIQGIGDYLMDGYNYLKQKMKDVYNWAVKKVKGVWTFVCEIAGSVKQFVLDCVEKIGEAAMWVWEKIKLGIQKLIDFAGFLFNWGDIKATKNTILEFLDAGIDYGVSKMKSLEGTVENFFVRLENQLVSGMMSTDFEPGPMDDTISPMEKIDEAQNSSAFKWVLERLKNGGADTGMNFSDNTSPGPFTGSDSFYEIIKPIGQEIMNTFSDLGKDLGDLFRSSNGLTAAEMWKKLGRDFLKNGLRVVKAIVISLVKLGAKLLELIKAIGKRKIEIPIFSALWRKISGADLSLFDSVALVLGVMTTILSKVILGHTPAKFANLNASFIGDLVDGKSSVTVKKDFAKFSAVLALNVTLLSDLISVIQFFTRNTQHSVEKLTPGTAVLVLKSLVGVLGLISACPTDDKIPGYQLRRWTVYLGCTTIGATTLYTLSPLGGPDANKKLQIFNFIMALVNFGLYDAIYAAELDDKSQFEGKDEQISAYGIVENTFATVNVGAKCVAINTIDRNPPAAVIAMAVMHGANRLLAINKGFTISRTAAIQAQSVRGVPAPL